MGRAAGRRATTQEEEAMSERRQASKDGILWGAVLILMGVFFILVQRDLLPERWLYRWWTWWPAILVVIGVAKFVRPGNAGEVGTGVTMILMGFWFFANQFGWYGLDWGNSWPLALVAVGAGMVAKAVAMGVMGGSGKEESRG